MKVWVIIRLHTSSLNVGAGHQPIIPTKRTPRRPATHRYRCDATIAALR